jgi:hypothetical protein
MRFFVLALLLVGCSSESSPGVESGGPAGTSSLFIGDDLTAPTPKFVVHTPDRFCLSEPSSTSSVAAQYCDVDSDLLSWDDVGQIRFEDGECLSAADRIFDEDGDPLSILDLTPFDANPARSYPCDGGADQAWSYTDGQIWMPLPNGDPGVACLEFAAQSSTAGMVFTDVADSLDDCILGQTWHLGGPPSVSSVTTSTCDVDYRVTSQWDGGFVAEVDVTLLAPQVFSWTMEWQFIDDGPEIDWLWGGSFDESGGNVVVQSHDWNSQLSTGQTITVGFLGTGLPPADPFDDFTFNDMDCLNGAPTEYLGPPVFPLWTGETATCVTLDGPTLGLGDCLDPVQWRWNGAALQTFHDHCLSAGDPMVQLCDGTPAQQWQRNGSGAVFVEDGPLGLTCLMDDGGLDAAPVVSLDGCTAWNQGGTPSIYGPGATCEAEVVVDGVWSGGFQGTATFSWFGGELNEWDLSWRFTNGEQLASLWNGIGGQSTDTVSVANEGWNGHFEAGDTVSIGFVADGEPGDAADLMFHGEECDAP